jgi:hypothetical protein
MKIFFKEHMLRRGGDERSFGDNVNRKRIFSVYVDRKGGDSLTKSFEEEVMENSPFQCQVIREEVMQEVLGTRMGRKI